jgi:hypothetical protein
MAVARRFVVVFIVWLFPETVLAAPFDNEFEEKPWQEIEVQLPPFPQPENLIPFEVGSISDKQFLIDEKSISIGSDEVIRYSLVVISSSGARNISYEGMRCATAERRTYAFGRADRTWSKARGDKWIGIRGGSNSHHVALFADYFCAIGRRAIMEPEDAVRVLRYGIENTGT